jgi:hypothetical protein
LRKGDKDHLTTGNQHNTKAHHGIEEVAGTRQFYFLIIQELGERQAQLIKNY